MEKKSIILPMDMLNVPTSRVAIGGEGPDENINLPGPYPFVVAADSGADLLEKFGVSPDVLVGDLDSISEKNGFLGLCKEKAKTDKDESDFELALMKVDTACYDLIGGGGGRMDHFVMIWSVFLRFSPPRFWFTKHDFLVSFKHIRFSLPVDTLVTVMAIDEKVVNARSKGLKWELDNFPLSYKAVSLSNRTDEEVVEIEGDGTLFLRMDISDHGRLEILSLC